MVNGRLYIQIGDVTGHGIQAALVTASVAGAITSTYKLFSQMRQSTLEANTRLLLESADEAVAMSGRNGGPVMTMAFIGVDLKTGEGIYLNAAHVPVLLIHGDGVHSLLAAGAYLGSLGTPGLQRFNFGVNDALFLFTDGLTENCQRFGKRFSMSELKKIIRSNSGCQNIKDAMIHLYDEKMAEENGDDDVTFLVVRRKQAA